MPPGRAHEEDVGIGRIGRVHGSPFEVMAQCSTCSPYSRARKPKTRPRERKTRPTAGCVPTLRTYHGGELIAVRPQTGDRQSGY